MNYSRGPKFKEEKIDKEAPFQLQTHQVATLVVGTYNLSNYVQLDKHSLES